MSFGQSVRVVLFKKYATFKGRASRSEYWWWYLFFVLAQVIFIAAEMETLIAVFVVAVLIPPHLAVAVRRLHDIGLSGLWAFIYYISLPLFLFIVLPLDYWQMLWMATPDQAYTQLGLKSEGMLLAFLEFWFLINLLLFFLLDLKSGGMLLTFLVFWLFVSFLSFVLFCFRGTYGANRYGTDPLR